MVLAWVYDLREQLREALFVRECPGHVERERQHGAQRVDVVVVDLWDVRIADDDKRHFPQGEDATREADG